MTTSNTNTTWFRYPEPEMISNLQHHKQISSNNKRLILDHVSQANHPVHIQFNTNAIHVNKLKDPPEYRLYDNIIEPAWNQTKMVQSYENSNIGFYNGVEVKRKIQSQFTKSRKYTTLAQQQDQINAQIKANLIQDNSIHYDAQLINDSIKNTLEWSQWMAQQQSKRKNKIKTYLMAERYNHDLTDLGLNNYCKNNGISGFALKELSLPFPGFNDVMTIFGGRFYIAALHTENLDADSFNLQTHGLKIWCCYTPSDSSKIEEYLLKEVEYAPFLTENTNPKCHRFVGCSKTFQTDPRDIETETKAKPYLFITTAGSLMRIPPGWYHTVYALDDFNACEAVNCGPMTSTTLSLSLKLGLREIDHDINGRCDCASTFNNKGDEIAKLFAGSQPRIKIEQKISQLLTSENITKQISITSSAPSSRPQLSASDFIKSSSTTYTSQLAKSKNISNQIPNKSVGSRPQLSLSDFTESSWISNTSSITCASPSEITISQSNHDINSSSIKAPVNNNNHNHNNTMPPSVNAPSINQTKQKKKRQYKQRKHNEVEEIPSMTHIDNKSGRTFQCKGWIFKVFENRTQRLKLVICDFCKSEPPKLIDQCGLRRHLESKHRNESELKITDDYKCRYCSKKFTRKYNLEEHERTHSGEKPFVCVHCCKAFTQKTGLTQHQSKCNHAINE